MLKNNFKALLLLGMLFSRVVVAADAPLLTADLMDITARLNEQELKLIENHDRVVALTHDLIQALNSVDMKQDSALRDVKELISLGYSVAPYDEALEAVNHAISLCSEQNPNHLSLQPLFSYKEMLEKGQATLVVEEMADRRSRRTKRFCRVCVSSLVARCITANSAQFCNACVTGVLSVNTINGSTCASSNTGTTGCFLNINSDVTVCPSNVLNVCNINGRTCAGAPTGCPLLINSNVTVCGSVNAIGGFGPAGTCNPAATPVSFNAPITTCGNVTFNTATTPLNAQGAFEASLRAIRGTVSLAASAITLVVGAGVPDSAIPVTGTLPTATIASGLGFSLLPVVGTARSSGIVVPTATAGISEFYFAVNLQIPITFAAPAYLANPSILLALQNLVPAVTDTAAIATTNTTTVVQAVASNVGTGAATINVVFNVTAQGATYAAAAVNAADAINLIINRGLLVNLLSDGTVA